MQLFFKGNLADYIVVWINNFSKLIVDFKA